MCGLAGFTGFGKADPAKMRMLIIENQERGSHSTGIYGYGKNLMRKACPAKEFVRDSNFDHIANSNIVIGHTRYSTGTARTKENAHPFLFDLPFDKEYGKQLIAGTHNGWVVNEHEVETKVEGYERANVDSASIFKLMQHLELLKGKKRKDALSILGISSPEYAFSIFEGAMALAFIYKGCLHLYRRESRPLFIGKTKEGIYYSSIKDSLLRIGVPEDKIFGVKPHRLIKFVGSRIQEINPISEPRVRINEHTSPGFWDSAVNNKLVEELTGKKSYPAAQRDTQGTRHTDTDRKTGRTNTTQETVKAGEKEGNGGTKILTMAEVKSLSGRAVYGKNILMPSVCNENFDINLFLKSSISNSPSRQTGIETIAHLKQIKNFWPGRLESKTCLTRPLYSVITDRKLEVKNKDAAMISVNFRGYKDSIGEVFYGRDDMYACVSVGGSTDKEANYNGFMKVDNSSQVANYLTTDFIKDDQVVYMIDVQLFFARVPGFMFTTSVRLFKGQGVHLRMYFDLDALEDYRKGLSVTNHIPKIFPVGQWATSLLNQSRDIYDSIAISDDIDISRIAPYSLSYDMMKKKGKWVTAYEDKKEGENHLFDEKGNIVSIQKKTLKEEILESLKALKEEMVVLSERIHQRSVDVKKKTDNGWGVKFVEDSLTSFEADARRLRELSVYADMIVEKISKGTLVLSQ